MPPHPAPTASLAEAIRSPSFTPPLREAPALFALLGGPDPDLSRDAERALLRAGPAVLEPVLERLRAGARPPLRGRLCRVIGRLAPRSGAARAALLSIVADPAEDEKTRRNAVIALGALGPDAEGEEALLGALRRGASLPLQRSLVDALGKVGGDAALARLRALRPEDPELRRLTDRAVLMLERTAARPIGAGADGGQEAAAEARRDDRGLDVDRVPPGPLPVLLRCRPGLEEVLHKECDPSLEARVVGPGQIAATLRGPARDLLSLRTLLGWGFLLPRVQVQPSRGDGGEDALADAVARALSEQARGILPGLCEGGAGPVRFRLRFGAGGPRRALVWRCASLISRRAPWLRNDPTASPFEVVVLERRGGIDVVVEPRRLPDERFTYRVAAVPAASHPTVAAALALLGGVRADDVVWDPFVGSGLELIERARLGPYASLWGTDLEEAALEAAGRNLAAAGVHGAHLVRADARAFMPGPGERPSLILSNPPMGRRVLRGGGPEGEGLGEVLEAVARRAAQVLVPGGRLVWGSPLPERTLRAARQAGLRGGPALGRDLDMGGFSAQVQRFTRPG
jgi:precorrin-6B methylase 2